MMCPELNTLFFRSLGLVALALFFDLIVRFYGFWLRKAEKPGWLAAVEGTVRKSILWLIWGFTLFTLLLWSSLEMCLPVPPDFLEAARQIFVILMVSWTLFLLKKQLEKRWVERAIEGSKPLLDKSLVVTFSKLSSIAIVLVAALFLLHALGVPLTAVLAFGGIGGLAFGLAAKDVIANFFGGLMIFINRPFSEGDWIKSPNKNFEGVVEGIGWYMTRIRTFERRPTYVPNAMITDAIIENPGRMYNRRIREMLHLRYEDLEKVPAITEEIRQMLTEHPEIDSKQFILTEMVAYGENSIDLDVYCFTKPTRTAEFRKVQQDVLLKMGEIVKKFKADFAVPVLSVHLDEPPGKKRSLPNQK